MVYICELWVVLATLRGVVSLAHVRHQARAFILRLRLYHLLPHYPETHSRLRCQ